MEAARRAGIRAAIAAATPSVKIDPMDVLIAALPADLRAQAKSAMTMIRALEHEQMLLVAPGISESH